VFVSDKDFVNRGNVTIIVVAVSKTFVFYYGAGISKMDFGTRFVNVYSAFAGFGLYTIMSPRVGGKKKRENENQ